MNEFELSAAHVKSDLKAHDLPGAWREFSREVLSLESRRLSQRDGAKMEREYFAEVLKQAVELERLGFPTAKLHQNGNRLEMVFSDSMQGPGSLEWTSFTLQNRNKKSHDLSAQEVAPIVELQSMTPKEDKSMQPINGRIEGRIVQKESISSSEQRESFEQGRLQGSADEHSGKHTYNGGTDQASVDERTRSVTALDIRDNFIDWNDWAHRLQATLQHAVSNDWTLKQFMMNRNGNIQFRFTVDRNQNISRVEVRDSGLVDPISIKCASLIDGLNRSPQLRFPNGSERNSYDFHWVLPYGTKANNALNLTNVSAEHQTFSVYTYGNDYKRNK